MKLEIPEAPEGYLFKLKGDVNCPYLEFRKYTWLGSKLIVCEYLDAANDWQIARAAERCIRYNETRLAMKAAR